MVSLREDEDPFEEDIVFDQQRLLCTRSTKMKSAIHRVSSGKCVLFAKTLGLCGAFFGMGLCTTIPDNTFSESVTEFHKSTSPSMSLFTSRTCGYLIGAVIAGFLFDRYNRLFLLFVSLLMTSTLVVLTPWCQTLWLLQTIMVSTGITLGFLTTGGNVLCLDLWGRNSGPFMQAIHFSFALGSLVAPLISLPTVESLYQPGNSIQNTSNIKHNIFDYSTTVSSYAKEGVHRRVFRELNDTNFLDYHSQIVFNNSTSKFSLYSSASPDVNETLSHSTESYSSTTLTTKRTPKPKPKLTNGAKLGHSRDWDNIPVRKPPKEDLIPVTQAPSSTSVTFVNSSHSFQRNILSSSNKTLSTPFMAVSQLGMPETNLNAKNTSSFNVTDISSTLNDAHSHIAGDNQTSTTQRNKFEGIDSTVDSNKSIHLHSPQEKGNILLFSTEASKVHLQSNNGHAGREGVKYHSKNIETQVILPTEAIKNYLQSNLFHTDREGVGHKSTDVVNGKETKQILNETEHYSGNKTTNLPTVVAVRNVTYSENEIIRKPVEFSTSVTEPVKVHRVHHLKPGTYDNDTEDINTLFGIVAQHVEKYGFSRLQFTYLMVGLFVFVVSLVFLGFLCNNPRDPKSKQEEHCSKSERMSNWHLQLLLVLLVSLIFFLCVGLEGTVYQLVAMYAINGPLHLSVSYVSNIQTSFLGSFTAMRFSSIFCSSGLRPSVMLGLNFAFCFVGTGILLTFAFKFESALLIGCSLIGIGLASVVPSGILWLERYIYISNKIAALLVFSSGLGQVLSPHVIYSIMSSNPDMFIYSITSINILCLLTALTLCFLTGKCGEKYCTISHVGYQLANQMDEEDMLDMASVQPMWRHSFSLHNGSLRNGHVHLRQ